MKLTLVKNAILGIGVTIMYPILIILAAIGIFLYVKSLSAKKVSPGYFDYSKIAPQNNLPSINNNPLENKPDLNPASKANPIKDIKTNPFE